MSWDQRYSAVLDKCVDSLKIWKTFIEENLEENEKEAEIQKLKQLSKEYMNIHNCYEKSKGALKAVEEAVTDNEKTHDIDELYNTLLSTQTINKDSAKEEIWEQVFGGRQSVKEVKPKSTKLNDAQFDLIPGTENDSLLCSNVFEPPVDPMSKAVILNPVVNKKCKHVYDSQTIYDYMKQRKQRAKCPYIGCKNEKIVPGDLAEDSELKEKISQYLATQSQEQSDSDSSDE